MKLNFLSECQLFVILTFIFVFRKLISANSVFPYSIFTNIKKAFNSASSVTSLSM